MSIYLEHLKEAFESVNEIYFSSWAFNEIPIDAKLKERKKYKQYIERVFAYELYHQFRLLMIKNEIIYKDLVLNGEVKKDGFKETLINKSHIYPDLVLHKKQTDNSKEFQKLFIEIKSKSISPKEIKNDIAKLITAVSNRLNFECAVFICIYLRFEEIEKHIETIINNQKNDFIVDDLNKIWLLNNNGLKNFKEFLK